MEMELISVRLPKELKEDFEKIARAGERSVSNLARLIIKRYVANYKRRRSPDYVSPYPKSGRK